MGLYDRAARRATKAEPLAVMRRVGELAGLAWCYRDWAPTQTTPRVEERDQIADRAVILDDLRQRARVWLAVLEFQARHDEDKLDDLLAEAGQFRRDLRHGPLAEGKYTVLPVLIYLVGLCPDAAKDLDMTTPSGCGIRAKPVLWEIGRDSATAALDDFEQGKTSWGIFFWAVLMAGAAEAEVVERWRRLVNALPASRDRADLIGIALVFAELVGRGQVWRRVLEGWNMTESAIFNEWMAEAQEESKLEGAREMMLSMLDGRFPGQVPCDIAETIQEQPSLSVLRDWGRKAAVLSLEDFRAYLRR